MRVNLVGIGILISVVSLDGPSEQALHAEHANCEQPDSEPLFPDLRESGNRRSGGWWGLV
jgi:hypothetical protein